MVTDASVTANASPHGSSQAVSRSSGGCGVDVGMGSSQRPTRQRAYAALTGQQMSACASRSALRVVSTRHPAAA